ncbi:MAG: hypothetical protein JNM79_19985 [Burkholderiales bacterium]|nr:hypothetical protein [Burkholderiales bacterium]
MEVAPQPVAPPLRRSTIVWLLLYAALACWILVTLARAWPYANHPVQMPLLLCVPGMLYCGFKLVYAWRLKKPLAGWRKWLALPIICVCGLFGAGWLWGVADRLSMVGFERNIAPLVAAIEANRASVCQPAQPYRLSAEFRAYLDSSNAVRSGLKIQHGGGRVVLSTGGRSADIDGSTLYYDLAEKRWVKFHNDNADKRAAFEALTRDMADCRIAFA